jgi:hypothetical protein
LLGELGGQSDGVGVGLDTDGLKIDLVLIAWFHPDLFRHSVTNLGVGVSGVFSRVLVEEVERIAGELHATGLLALHEEGILAACVLPKIPSTFQFNLSLLKFHAFVFHHNPGTEFAYG